LNDWFDDYNKRNPCELCPAVLLTPSCPKEILRKWLCVETRNKDGDQYHPKSIMSLLSGTLRLMRAENSNYANFLDKKDSFFYFFT
jgi:hypothetical protein